MKFTVIGVKHGEPIVEPFEGDYDDAREILARMRLGHMECPVCCEPLDHFSGLEQCPEYYYCGNCQDWAYSESGERLFRLV